jgi:two-component system, LuxR family, response regulator FixJ
MRMAIRRLDLTKQQANLMMRNDCQIFVVDDDDAVRDSLCLMLRTTYPNVAGYSSGPEFLANHQLRRRNCLIIDIHMPELSGIDVVGRLSEMHVRIPTILMTGRVDSTLRSQAIGSGAYVLLDKPIDFDALNSAIEQALATPSLH